MARIKQKITLNIIFDDEMGLDVPEYWDWATMVNPGGLADLEVELVKAGKLKDCVPTPSMDYVFG